MKRTLFQLLVCLCLCAALPQAGRAAGDWHTVQALREMTRGGWHQTYETPWRTVRIDTDITVPKVDAFPVIKVRRVPAVDISAPAFDGWNVRVNNPGDFYAEYGSFPQSADPRGAFRDALNFGSGIPDRLPENNPMTYPQALTVFDSVLYSVYGLGIDRFALDSNRVIGRYYQYKIADGKRVWLEPLNDRGFYQLSGQQLFHGIPLQYCGNYTTNGKNPADATAVLSVADADAWIAHLAVMREVETVAVDIPLLSFAAAKTAMEAQITDGHIREVLNLQLCYTSYIDPEDDEEYYLLPVWYARCVYAKRADMEFTPCTYPVTGEADTDTLQYTEVVFEAQKGTLMNWEDSRPARRDVPEVITWNDVP